MSQINCRLIGDWLIPKQCSNTHKVKMLSQWECKWPSSELIRTETTVAGWNQINGCVRVSTHMDFGTLLLSVGSDHSRDKRILGNVHYRQRFFLSCHVTGKRPALQDGLVWIRNRELRHWLEKESSNNCVQWTVNVIIASPLRTCSFVGMGLTTTRIVLASSRRPDWIWWLY